MEIIIGTINLTFILQFIIDFSMVLAPSLGYVLQSIKFHQTKSSKGFSKYLCLLIVLANLLRIFFWIAKPFAKSLLFQSFTIIISQFYLIHLCLLYQEHPKEKHLLPEFKEEEKSSNKKNLYKYDNKSIIYSMISWKETLNFNKLWNWDNEIEYYKFTFFLIFFFTLSLGTIGKRSKNFIEILGALSVTCESIVLIPQIRENCRTKDTKNISSLMVFLWLGGDIFKLLYNYFYKSPVQLIIGGFIQIFFNLIVSTQLILYGNMKESSVVKFLLCEKDSKKNKKKRKNFGDEESKTLIDNGEDNNYMKEKLATLKVKKEKNKSKDRKNENKEEDKEIKKLREEEILKQVEDLVEDKDDLEIDTGV